MGMESEKSEQRYRAQQTCERVTKILLAYVLRGNGNSQDGRRKDNLI